MHTHTQTDIHTCAHTHTHTQTDDIYTFSPSCLVVCLAHQFPVVDQVELVASGELMGADEAGKTLKMVDVLLSSPNHLRRRNELIAASTQWAKESIILGRAE